LGLRPRQGLARLRAKRGSPRVKESVGMNSHTPKGVSTLGVGVSMDSQMFRG